MRNTQINVRFATGSFSAERSTVVSLITNRLDMPAGFGRSNPWRLQLQDVRPQITDKQMLMLLNPRVLSRHEDPSAVIDRTFECVSDHGYEIEGVSLLSGPYIDKQGIFERHFGRTDSAYRLGFGALSLEALKNFEEAFGVKPQSCDILGGPGFMQAFKMFPQEVADFWASAQRFGRVRQLSPEVYCAAYSSIVATKYLINGFHASSVAQFCNPGNNTAAVSIRSGKDASSWKSISDSLPSAAGVQDGIYLSAGPIGSIGEISNWFPWIKPAQTVMGRLFGASMNDEQIAALLKNPEVSWNGEVRPIFDHTKASEPEEAIAIASITK